MVAKERNRETIAGLSSSSSNKREAVIMGVKRNSSEQTIRILGLKLEILGSALWIKSLVSELGGIVIVGSVTG